jgi:hypothetical protein
MVIIVRRARARKTKTRTLDHYVSRQLIELRLSFSVSYVVRSQRQRWHDRYDNGLVFASDCGSPIFLLQVLRNTV